MAFRHQQSVLIYSTIFISLIMMSSAVITYRVLINWCTWFWTLTTIMRPVHLNSVIISYINNRFNVPVDQPTIYNWFNRQQTLKLPLTFTDLAVYDGNRLTQALLFENASCIFGYPISQVVTKRVWDSNWTRPFFSLPNDKEKKAVWPRKTTPVHLRK